MTLIKANGPYSPRVREGSNEQSSPPLVLAVALVFTEVREHGSTEYGVQQSRLLLTKLMLLLMVRGYYRVLYTPVQYVK